VPEGPLPRSLALPFPLLRPRKILRLQVARADAHDFPFAAGLLDGDTAGTSDARRPAGAERSAARNGRSDCRELAELQEALVGSGGGAVHGRAGDCRRSNYVLTQIVFYSRGFAPLAPFAHSRRWTGGSDPFQADCSG